jgi:uncharacterized phage protein gp47/JayE
MPFDVPTLQDARQIARDFVSAKLPGSELAPPNSRIRVISDNNAGLAHLNFLFLYWLSQQFLPDTAETDWLDRHANIWLGGRKAATYAGGTVNLTGTAGVVVPAGTQLFWSTAGIPFQTIADITLGSGSTAAPVIALAAGVAGNASAGAGMGITTAIAGLDGTATVVAIAGGADAESDDDLRARVLFRIQQPPMGGDADDYVRWALEVPGVTRAWCSPLEMGIGTVTVRFMMDDLRATSDPTTSGFPTTDDIAAVQAHLDLKRPVAVKDFFVEAPIPEPIDFTISNLDVDTSATRAAIAASVATMLSDKAKPAFALNGVGQSAQTIYASWVSEAISQAFNVDHFDLTMSDHPMPNAGALAVIGTITYV